MYDIHVSRDENYERYGSEGVVDGDFRVDFSIHFDAFQAEGVDVTEIDFDDGVELL